MLVVVVVVVVVMVIVGAAVADVVVINCCFSITTSCEVILVKVYGKLQTWSKCCVWLLVLSDYVNGSPR